MIEILRLHHRIARDKRITTHLALTSRACGASSFYYSGDTDSSFERSLQRVSEQFGGSFLITHIEKEISFLTLKKKEGFTIVHLTMYGLPFEKNAKSLSKKEKILFVVGGEKVEGEYYQISDYNLSVSNQPLSEVSALGILLYTLQGFSAFPHAKMKVIPMERGKKVENT